MPRVGRKKYPYTKAGKEAAKKAGAIVKGAGKKTLKGVVKAAGRRKAGRGYKK